MEFKFTMRRSSDICSAIVNQRDEALHPPLGCHILILYQRLKTGDIADGPLQQHMPVDANRHDKNLQHTADSDNGHKDEPPSSWTFGWHRPPSTLANPRSFISFPLLRSTTRSQRHQVGLDVLQPLLTPLRRYWQHCPLLSIPLQNFEGVLDRSHSWHRPR
ncbi:hypothetical protein CPC08DRAFT_137396 [Agrocybe pediades]|nr:hypothetical protein CPC08DRAFT_137396 [Agrocybe pediades]